jgi:diguanylate cyclase (GGDEF)-like protein
VRSIVTPTKSVRKTVQASPEFFAARLMEFLVVPAFVLDATGKVMIWNKACERLTATPAAEVLGTRDHWRAFYDHKRPCLADIVLEDRFDEVEKFYVAVPKAQSDLYGLSAENWCVMPRVGRQLYVAIDVGAIFDERGTLIAVVETLRDMTIQKAMELELQELAGRDSLTGLANRRTFDRRLKEVFANSAGSNGPASLLLIDIDCFKACNDKFGHPVGDNCLREVAECIKSASDRDACLAARIGGDEFALIVPDISPDDARLLAEYLRGNIEQRKLPFASDDAEKMTLSVGLAPSSDFSSADEWIAAADSALYRAKKGGRNRVSAFEGLEIPLRRSA